MKGQALLDAYYFYSIRKNRITFKQIRKSLVAWLAIAEIVQLAEGSPTRDRMISELRRLSSYRNLRVTRDLAESPKARVRNHENDGGPGPGQPQSSFNLLIFASGNPVGRCGAVEVAPVQEASEVSLSHNDQWI